MAKFIGIVGFTLLMWTLCLGYAQKLQSYDNIIDIQYKEEKLTLEHYKELQKDLPYKSVAWLQREGIKFYNPALSQGMDGIVLQIKGQSELITHRHLTEGVVLTTSIAYKLWGSTEIVGETIEIEGEPYTIQDVIEGDAPYVIVPIDHPVDGTFDGIRMNLEGVDNIPQEINTIEMKHNLPKGVPHNIGVKVRLLCQILLLPPWVLVGYSLIKLYKWLYHNYRYWVLTLLVGIVAFLGTWLISSKMPISMTIPYYVLPNQWSDFEFWGRTINQAIQNSKDLQSLPSYLPSQQINQLMGMYLVYLVGGIIGSICMIKYIVSERFNQLLWQILLSSVISFITLMWIDIVGGPVVIHDVLWIGIPTYLLIIYSIKKLNRLISDW